MIFGIDVSNYQAGIDMGRARAEGMDFVLAKVTEGTTYRNPAWPAQRDGARNAGLFLAGYHYVRTGNPAGEAAACKAWLGDTTIPIMLDWEQNGGDWNNFLAVLAAFRAVGLRVVFGYIPRWYWAQQGSPNITTSGLALVSSRYPTTNGGTPAGAYTAVTPTTWSGYGGLNPTILQFTDRATVAGTPIDANAFLGSRDQLAALFGAPTTPAPKGLFMTLTPAQEATILEAAESVLFGRPGVRNAGQMAMAVYGLMQSVEGITKQVDTLAARPAVQVDTAPIVAAVVDAVARAGVAQQVLDGLAARLSAKPAA